MSKNIPVKGRVIARLEMLKEKTGIANYSDLVESVLDKAYPLEKGVVVPVPKAVTKKTGKTVTDAKKLEELKEMLKTPHTGKDATPAKVAAPKVDVTKVAKAPKAPKNKVSKVGKAVKPTGRVIKAAPEYAYFG